MKKVSIILLVTLTSAINAAERQDPRPLTALSPSRNGLWSQDRKNAAKKIADKVEAEIMEAAKAKEKKEGK